MVTCDISPVISGWLLVFIARLVAAMHYIGTNSVVDSSSCFPITVQMYRQLLTPRPGTFSEILSRTQQLVQTVSDVYLKLIGGANDLYMIQLMPLPPHHPYFRKIQNGLPLWCRRTQVVLEKRPLNVCMYVCYWFARY